MSAHLPRPWLLVSDIDDTLTGDDAALRCLGEAIGRERHQLWFAVNSSRPAPSVRETLGSVFPGGLVPDAIITALGTEITVAGVTLPDWESRFTGWPQERVFALVAALGHRPHDRAFQTRYKVSFDVPGAEAQAEVHRKIARSCIPCRTIVSGHGDFDIIPATAGKDAATLHLAGRLGCDISHVIVAGDSANDLAMFRAVPRGIAVANARPELLDRLDRGTFYHATAPHAAGVLEGLVHYGALRGDVART